MAGRPFEREEGAIGRKRSKLELERRNDEEEEEGHSFVVFPDLQKKWKHIDA